MKEDINAFIKRCLYEQGLSEMLLNEIQAYIYSYGVTPRKIQLTKEFADELKINPQETTKIFDIPVEIVDKIKFRLL